MSACTSCHRPKAHQALLGEDLGTCDPMRRSMMVSHCHLLAIYVRYVAGFGKAFRGQVRADIGRYEGA
jgi:hypothetical protein